MKGEPLHSHGGVRRCECRLAAKASERSWRCVSTSKDVSRPTTPRRNPVVRGTKVLPALNAPTKALKNARIRRPFKGDAQSLAADVRGRKHHNLPLWDHNPKRTCIASDE